MQYKYRWTEDLIFCFFSFPHLAMFIANTLMVLVIEVIVKYCYTLWESVRVWRENYIYIEKLFHWNSAVEDCNLVGIV